MIWQIGIGTKIPSEIEETDLQEEELLAAWGFQSPGGDGFRNRNATDLVQWWGLGEVVGICLNGYSLSVFI